MYVRSYYLFSLVFVSTISLGMEEVFNPNFFEAMDADLKSIVKEETDSSVPPTIGKKSKALESEIENPETKKQKTCLKARCNICNKKLSSTREAGCHIVTCHILNPEIDIDGKAYRYWIQCTHPNCAFERYYDWPNSFNTHHNKKHGECCMLKCLDEQCKIRSNALRTNLKNIKNYLRRKDGNLAEFKKFKKEQLDPFAERKEESANADDLLAISKKVQKNDNFINNYYSSSLTTLITPLGKTRLSIQGVTSTEGEMLTAMLAKKLGSIVQQPSLPSVQRGQEEDSSQPAIISKDGYNS